MPVSFTTITTRSLDLEACSTILLFHSYWFLINSFDGETFFSILCPLTMTFFCFVLWGAHFSTVAGLLASVFLKKWTLSQVFLKLSNHVSLTVSESKNYENISIKNYRSTLQNIFFIFAFAHTFILTSLMAQMINY